MEPPCIRAQLTKLSHVVHNIYTKTLWGELYIPTE